MLTHDRQSKILSILDKQGSVTVSRLTEILSTSESTIRRDLSSLASEGKLNKVHGGATALNQEFVRLEDNIEEKLTKHTNEKNEIAQYAAGQIKDDDFVFIDAGSTTRLMIKYLSNSKATFVTNGIDHAKQLAQNGCKTIVIGGQLKQSTEAIIGLMAATNLQKFSFTKAFIGTNGISEKQGYTTPDTEEAMLKAVAIERSFVSYVLADNSKFDKVSAVTFGSLDTACIITDKCPNEKVAKHTVVKEVLK
ncbi:MAG: DeoR/GlpR family DNA-binding transcription regulator [Eubacterium sp.]|nr:DeoR/GlpR family DNA-binding transcription regulator [Eubacterium sp.]